MKEKEFNGSRIVFDNQILADEQLDDDKYE
jgi:hypothetical protein